MTDPLAGRTAVVTGAGNGLGQAIAWALAARGVRVCLVGRNAERLAQTAESALSGGTRVARCDVSDPESVERLRGELVDEQISILMNVAGGTGPVKALVDVTPQEWDETFNTNVRSIYLMCRAFLPAMIATRRGDIVNVASVSGKRPLVHRVPYCASKMAIIGLTRTLAAEVGRHGISVNTLSPGPVRGPRMERLFAMEAQKSGITPEEAERNFVSRAAFERLTETDEVADAAVAILSMHGMTGADIDLSAGMIAPS